MRNKELKFDTLQLHAGQSPDSETGSRAVPIYQTTSYVFNNTEHAADLFALKKEGNLYTRIMNPTTDVIEKRIAALEGGKAALAVASGSAAITYSILNLAKSGDEIVAAKTLYGGTYNLLKNTLPKFGINTIFIDSDDIDNFDKAITEKTKAILIETIGNPGINLIDIDEVSKIAKKYKIPLIVDNTFATPYLFRPIEHGADIVVHSMTKFIGGHGNSIGGIIVDSGTFDWVGSGKFPDFVNPDSSYHGISYAKDVGELAYIVKARVQLLRDTGAALSPFNAFLILIGVETLSLRMQKHVENTEKIAEYLEKHDMVSWVNYPSLKSSKYKKLAQKYFSRGTGAILTFGIKGGMKTVAAFIDGLEIISLLANVGDAKSLVIHPASTTHQQLSEKDQRAAGITQDMIRLSIGIEDIEDLIEDIGNAFEKAKVLI